jgi:hypothetical protein
VNRRHGADPDAGEVQLLPCGDLADVAPCAAQRTRATPRHDARRPFRLSRRRPRDLRLDPDAGAVMLGAGFPAVFFIVAAAGAIDDDLAFRLAKWTGLGLICAHAFL